MAEGKPRSRPRVAATRKKEPTGPYIAAAFLCENILSEEGYLLSAIRIVDQITFAPKTEGNADEQPVLLVNLKALVIFRAGEGIGSHNASFRLRDPQGEVLNMSRPLPFELPRPNSGFQIPTDIGFQVKQPGLYWIDVLLDGDVVTRISLEVRVAGVTNGGQEQLERSKPS